MEEGTSTPSEVVYTERVEGGDHGMDGGREEVMGPVPVPVQEREQVQGDVGDELADVVVEGNVQAVVADSGHTHRVDPSQTEEGHSFHIGNEEVEAHTLQADQVVECDNGVMPVAAAVARFARTSNSHDGRTVCCQRAAGSGKSG